MAKPYFRLSVHQLVDFLLREGDIDARIYNVEAMQEGTRLHGLYQSKQGADYEAELSLSRVYEREGGTIALRGKADGYYLDSKGIPVIEEIKSTAGDVDEFARVQAKWHFAQAECYASMLFPLHPEFDEIKIRLVYLSQKGEKKAYRRETLSREDLEEKVGGYLDSYLSFFGFLEERREERNESIKALEFPFQRFRAGQKEMGAAVYRALADRKRILIEAPTGIGKTVGATFAAFKGMGEKKADKLFYFTAKTTGALMAEKAMRLLKEKGLKARYSALLGKKKMCLSPGAECNPDECPFARSYYPKLREAVSELLSQDVDFSSSFIKEYGLEKEMCPFELSLDLSNYSDIVIADFNYLIDPLARLERYFSAEAPDEDYFAMIDEAHNLLERARDAYGASLDAFSLKLASRVLKSAGYPKSSRKLAKVAEAIESVDQETQDDAALVTAIKAYEQTRREEERKETPDREKGEKPELPEGLEREVHRYGLLAEQYYEGSRILVEEGRVRRLCLDPSPYILDSLDRLSGAALYSGTLSPLPFYTESLLGESEAGTLLLPSPFDKSHMGLYVAPLGLRYKQREASFPEVISLLKTFVQGKVGNYLIFFPSFEYLEKAAPALEGIGNVLIQKREMGEEEKEEFLAHFVPNPSETNVGLAVLGGSFGEGVDLVSDRLIGVAIVGIGLPGVSSEREAIRGYFEERAGQGYYRAYLAPGLNKVMQGIGRLIRSEDDQGVALLIDDRYLQRGTRELLEGHYGRYRLVFSEEELRKGLSSFYGKK